MSSGPNRSLCQRTIGVLGGMSNQATGEYYRLINKRLNLSLGVWDNGEIVVVSVNLGNIEYFVRHDRWAEAKIYLAEKVDRSERAGAEVVLCVSNTMHRVVEPIMAERATPFIHIADPTGEAIRKVGLTRVALLGTMPVMRSAELAKRYAERFGVEVMVPSDPDKAVVDRIIFDELVRRDLRAGSKAGYFGSPTFCAVLGHKASSWAARRSFSS